jgi:AraC-like DNA-binding protein
LNIHKYADKSGRFNWNNWWITGKNSIVTQAMRQLQWPVRGRPKVFLAGLFPLEARGFDHVYRSGVHAIHLHEYAGTIRLGEEVHRLEPGTLTISPAEEESSYDLPRPGVHWCIHFEQLRVRRGEAAVGSPLVLRLGSQQGEAVKRFSHITRMRGLVGGDGEVMREAVSVALQELLLWVGMFEWIDGGRAERAGDLMIEGLYEYIDRNLGRRLSAEELAKVAGLSQNHLARRFRERTGSTLPSYVLARRIGLARLLLKATNLPIKQIAQRVGMPDAHHFNKQFRAVAGVSPSGFREG